MFEVIMVLFTILFTFFPIIFLHLYNLLLPPVDTGMLEGKVKVAASFLGFPADCRMPMPVVNIVESTDPVFNTMRDEGYDIVWGVYLSGWKRIYLSTESRQDTLYHELGHFLQDQHRHIPDDEDTAWAVTRHLMLVFHPFRYQFLMMLFGFFGIWGLTWSEFIREV